MSRSKPCSSSRLLDVPIRLMSVSPTRCALTPRQARVRAYLCRYRLIEGVPHCQNGLIVQARSRTRRELLPDYESDTGIIHKFHSLYYYGQA